MSKTGKTKNKILELLNEKSETLTTICKKLDLSPSTVSQHLKEMEDSGSIKPIDNSSRKWKYYEINRGNEMSNLNQRWYSNREVPEFANRREIEENGVLDFCKENRITIIAYSPLARGNLLNPRYASTIEKLGRIGRKHGKSPVQVALNYLISKKNVIVIPKASTKEHVIEILGSQGWHLTNNEMHELSSGERRGSLVGPFVPLVKSTGVWAGLVSHSRKNQRRSTTRSSKK